MELSRIFHDLGVFLHFQDYSILDDFIILQNAWATDAVFAVFDNAKVQQHKGKFTDNERSEIWKDKGYHPSVFGKLLGLMMQFELCYQVDDAYPCTYIIPEMLSDIAPHDYQWQFLNDMPLLYRYDFMPKGILTRFIVRWNKHIQRNNGQQVVWKSGVQINGELLGCPNTTADIREAWDNKQLTIRIEGTFSKRVLASKSAYYS